MSAYPVLGWLNVKGIRPPRDEAADVLAELFREPGRYRMFRDACYAVGESVTTTAHRLKKRGLPAGEEWRNAARTLGIVRLIRAAPYAPRWHLAIVLGLADHTSIHRRVRGVFGVTVAEAVKLSDADLMERWWNRCQQARKPLTARAA
jgi:hypothetical protein